MRKDKKMVMNLSIGKDKLLKLTNTVASSLFLLFFSNRVLNLKWTLLSKACWRWTALASAALSLLRRRRSESCTDHRYPEIFFINWCLWLNTDVSVCGWDRSGRQRVTILFFWIYKLKFGARSIIVECWDSLIHESQLRRFKINFNTKKMHATVDAVRE